MKFKILIWLILFSVSFVSCSIDILEENRKDLFVGLWKTEEVKGNFKVKNDSWESAIEEAKNTIYVFNENMTAEIRVRNITNKTKWQLVDNILILQRDNDHMEYQIVEINKNKMVLIWILKNGTIEYHLSKLKM